MALLCETLAKDQTSIEKFDLLVQNIRELSPVPRKHRKIGSVDRRTITFDYSVTELPKTAAKSFFW